MCNPRIERWIMKLVLMVALVHCGGWAGAQGKGKGQDKVTFKKEYEGKGNAKSKAKEKEKGLALGKGKEKGEGLALGKDTERSNGLHTSDGHVPTIYRKRPIAKEQYKHLRRMARIERLIAIGVATGNEELVEKAKLLGEKEQRRHAQVIVRLRVKRRTRRGTK